MILEKEQLVLQKNNLYRDNYRRIMSCLVVMVIVGLALLTILGYQIMTTRKPAYYATTTTGRVIPLQSLDMPVVTNSYLLQWAALAVRSVYNLNFEDYQKQLKVASSYFTVNGWNSLIGAMRKSNVIHSLTQNKLFMEAVVDGSPVILAEDIVHGRYTWRVQLPLLVTYTSANEERKAHFSVTMDIVRVPVIDTVKSIQINKFNVVRE